MSRDEGTGPWWYIRERCYCHWGGEHRRSERPGGGKSLYLARAFIWHCYDGDNPYILCGQRWCTWMRVDALYMAKKSCWCRWVGVDGFLWCALVYKCILRRHCNKKASGNSKWLPRNESVVFYGENCGEDVSSRVIILILPWE